MDGFDRDNFLTIDEFGIDPLLDVGFNAVQAVTSYSTFTVSQEYAGRPDTISHIAYRTVEFWWAIMAYNGITDIRDLTGGLIIKIPDLNQLTLNLGKIGQAYVVQSVSI